MPPLTGNQYSLSISNKICVCLLKRYFDIRFKGEERQFFGKVGFFSHHQIAPTCTVYALNKEMKFSFLSSLFDDDALLERDFLNGFRKIK